MLITLETERFKWSPIQWPVIKVLEKKQIVPLLCTHLYHAWPSQGEFCSCHLYQAAIKSLITTKFAFVLKI